MEFIVSPFQAPILRSDKPIYPVHLQVLRLDGNTVSGPGSTRLYTGFVQQLTDASTARDREQCLATDLNGNGLSAGFYLGRLAQSFNNLPVYVPTASLGASVAIPPDPDPPPSVFNITVTFNLPVTYNGPVTYNNPVYFYGVLVYYGPNTTVNYYGPAVFYCCIEWVPYLVTLSAGTYNDWVPACAPLIYISTSGGEVKITGMVKDCPWQVVTLKNIGPGRVVLSMNNNASLAANRFTYSPWWNYDNLTPGQVVLDIGESAVFWHDETAGDWNLIGLNAAMKPRGADHSPGMVRDSGTTGADTDYWSRDATWKTIPSGTFTNTQPWTSCNAGSAASTSSGTYADLQTVNVTSHGGQFDVSFQGICAGQAGNAADAVAIFRLLVDGVAFGTDPAMSCVAKAAQGNIGFCFRKVTGTLAAGAHTIKAQWKMSIPGDTISISQSEMSIHEILTGGSS